MSLLGWSHLTPADRAAILAGIVDGEAHGGPYHVEIYPADRCNIDCFFCSTAALRGTDEVPLPRFAELLAELREAGTRSLRLAGGGEPLFHRRIADFLRAIAASGLPVENLTTNGVLLSGEVRELLAAVCDQITVSLNTGDETTYAAMMRTTARNFHRVVDNVRGLIAARDGRGARRPEVNLQFLVWKGNYRTIPAMYELARGLGVDSIAWSGLAFLLPEDKMTERETDEMMELYEEVVRRDRYERISAITSLEQDLSARVAALNARLAGERSFLSRAAHLVRRKDLAAREKMGRLLARTLGKRGGAQEDFDDLCLIGWHSMVVRTTGGVAPCCILQGKELGNVYKQSVSEVWHGEAYRRFRAELRRILLERDAWSNDLGRDRTVEPLCGPGGGCPIATVPYGGDLRFRRSFQATLERLAHLETIEPLA